MTHNRSGGLWIIQTLPERMCANLIKLWVHQTVTMKSKQEQKSDVENISEILATMKKLKEDIRDINHKLDYVIELYGEQRFRKSLDETFD